MSVNCFIFYFSMYINRNKTNNNSIYIIEVNFLKLILEISHANINLLRHFN